MPSDPCYPALPAPAIVGAPVGVCTACGGLVGWDGVVARCGGCGAACDLPRLAPVQPAAPKRDGAHTPGIERRRG